MFLDTVAFASGTKRNSNAPGLSSVAATSSTKSSWIWARGGHWMLGQDRCAGKRLEESDMPSNVHTQIDGDRLVQTVVCRS